MDIPYSQSDKMDSMIARLERLSNTSAADYMKKLDLYMKTLTLDENIVPNKNLDVDTSAGIEWLVLVPLLYFIIVILLIGLIVCYIRYTNTRTPTDRIDHSRISSISQTSSRRNRTVTVGGTSLSEVLGNSKASKNSVKSMLSHTTYRSGVLLHNNKEYVSVLGYPTLKKASTAFNEIDFVTPKMGSHERPHNAYCMPLTYLSTNKQLPQIAQYGTHPTPNHSNSTKTTHSSSTDNFDNLSRDSLRASMESHRLLRMGNSKIRPDDTYSWSDNNAYYSTPMSEYKGHGIHQSLQGYQNEGFKDELHQEKTTDMFYESSFEMTSDYFQIHRQRSFRSSIAAMNVSSVSTTANNTSDSLNIHEHIEPLSNRCNTSDEAGVVRKLFTERVRGLSQEKNIDTAGSLPPLPPNRYHRRDIVGTPTTRRARIPITSVSPLGSRGSENSSLVDTSADSVNISLPSSIARFHASKVKPLTILSGTPIPDILRHDRSKNYENETPITYDMLRSSTNADNECHEDLISTCAIAGSLDRSIQDSIQQGSCFEICTNSSTSIEHSGNKKEIKEVSITQIRTTPTKQTATSEISNVINVKQSPVIYREGDAKMKRILSLDQLKSGRVSVEQRLRQFGYIKSVKHHGIYEEVQQNQYGEN